MARARRRPAGSSPSSPAYQRRNERARELGYRSYYDYRIHAAGRIPPDQPAPTGAARARARGHRGKQDLLRTLKPGDVIVVPDGLAAIAKDSKDRFARVDVMVLRGDGSAETFTIRRQSYDQMVATVAAIAGKGAVFSPSPSLDIRRLSRVADRADDVIDANMPAENIDAS